MADAAHDQRKTSLEAFLAECDKLDADGDNKELITIVRNAERENFEAEFRGRIERKIQKEAMQTRVSYGGLDAGGPGPDWGKVIVDLGTERDELKAKWEAADKEVKRLNQVNFELVAQTAEEGKARQATAFRDTLSAGAAAWIGEQLRSIGAVRLKLRNADGSHKHRRWFVWSVGTDGSLRVAWGKRRDGAEHFAWKQLSYAAPKQRTVTGVRESPAATNPLGLTVEVSEGAAVVVVAEDEWVRRFVLDLAAGGDGPPPTPRRSRPRPSAPRHPRAPPPRGSSLTGCAHSPPSRLVSACCRA